VTEQESLIGQENSNIGKLQHMYESTRIEPPQVCFVYAKFDFFNMILFVE